MKCGKYQVLFIGLVAAKLPFLNPTHAPRRSSFDFLRVPLLCSALLWCLRLVWIVERFFVLSESVVFRVKVDYKLLSLTDKL